MTLKSGVMAAEQSALHHKNKLHLKNIKVEHWHFK